jgi:hypothetical protein
MAMIRAIRGMKDILPPETSRWQWVESQAREVFELYGYQEIRLPCWKKPSFSPAASARTPTSWPRKCTPSPTEAGIP